jgi:hypothetical protein
MTATTIRRFPAPLSAVDHAGQPPAEASAEDSSTVTLVRDPLFAVIVASGAQPATVAAALALVEGGPGPADGGSMGCAARLDARTVVAGATAGAVFQSRGQEVECLLGGCAAHEARTVPTRTGDLYTLCSPGLLAAVAVPRIRSVLRSQAPPALIARRLLAFAHQAQDAREAAVVVFRVGA